MKAIQFHIIIIYISVTCFGCAKEKKDELIIEPVGGAYDYINNQTDVDLLVEFPVPIYKRSIDAVIFVDSTIQIPRLSTTKFFEDTGNFGFNPFPSHTFKELNFYRIIDQKKTITLTIKPVDNKDWMTKIISREPSGYGLTEYQLSIDKEDLK